MISSSKGAFLVRTEVTDGWIGAVCKLERVIGYFLTAGRRRSWFLNHALNYGSLSRWYHPAKAVLLFGWKGRYLRHSYGVVN